MIVALDVYYNDSEDCALAACVGFHTFNDDQPSFSKTIQMQGLQPYISGLFWKRELPPLLEMTHSISETIDLIIIDGYVTLGDRPGLGYYLWKALGEQISVIGVAKTFFQGARAMEVIRGTSKKPLFVTSIGIDQTKAAEAIHQMHGSFRIPTLLKIVDHLSKKIN